MSSELRITPNLSLPLEGATQTFAFIGRKRSGKTYAAGKLTECLLDAGVQVIVLDTLGVWYGLRLSADGKSPGYNIPILGGLRGDVPLEETGGALVADIAVDTRQSIIVDISQFSFAGRKRFASDFGARFWSRKKAEHAPSPAHLVLEECQLIIPQFVGKDEARMVGIYEEIVRLGGNFGIGVSMLTQRPQSVNKEALTQTECLFVFQVNGVPERKTLKEWIVHQGMDKALADELPGLPRGTAYVWSPQWLGILEKVQVDLKKTFDSSTTPKVGKNQERRDPKPIDLELFSTRMAETIEHAKAMDPKELKKRIAQLESEKRELAAGKTIADPAAIQRAVGKAVGETERRTQTQIATLERAQSQSIRAFEQRIDKAARLIEQGLAALRNGHSITTVPPSTKAQAHVGDTAGSPSRSTESPGEREQAPAVTGGLGAIPDFEPTRKQQEILNAIAWWESIGTKAPKSELVGVIALIDTSGGYFSNVAGPLVSAGLIVRRGGTIELTDAGRSIAEVPERVHSLSEYHDMIRSRVRKVKAATGKTIAILDAVIEQGGEEITIAAIGEAVGIDTTGGYFSNCIGPLSSLKLIERRSGIVTPTKLLFPEGLA